MVWEADRVHLAKFLPGQRVEPLKCVWFPPRKCVGEEGTTGPRGFPQPTRGCKTTGPLSRGPHDVSTGQAASWDTGLEGPSRFSPLPALRPQTILEGLALLERKTSERHSRKPLKECHLPWMRGGLGALRRGSEYPRRASRECQKGRVSPAQPRALAVGLAQMVASARRRQGLAHTDASVPKG